MIVNETSKLIVFNMSMHEKSTEKTQSESQITIT
jgi:hypothetical protein